MKKPLLILLIVIGFIPLLGFFHPGLPLTHDGKDHVARIANFYQNLQEGNVIPRWAGNLNWGYGHPILEFLYPLPSYLASLFHLFGFSFIDSAKIVFAIGMLFSGIFMYLWLAEFLPISAAFIGGILYMFTPYRFVEIFVRGDIGENLAFVFMPLTLLFLYRLYKKGRTLGSARTTNDVILVGISFACLMLAHNAIVLMYFPFILFYILYLVYLSKNKKNLLLTSGFSLLLGFALSAFFWIPALLEGKYTLRNIVTAGEYASRYVSVQQLLYGPWSFGGTGTFTVQLGIINWVILLFSVCIFFVLWKRKNNYLFLILGLVFYTIASVFLMVPQSQGVWEKIMLLQNFQFPWRFLAVPLFTTPVLGAILISLFFHYCEEGRRSNLVGVSTRLPRFARNDGIVIIFFLLILLFNKDYWRAQSYLSLSDNFFNSVYDSTTDTGESSPIWSIRFMEKQPKQPIEVIAGKARVRIGKRTITKHTYVVNASTPIVLRDNTVYFPGWEALQDGVATPIQYQDPHNRGVITFPVSKGEHTITVIYKETKLRVVADVLSLLGILFVIITITAAYITKKRQTTV